MTRNKKSCSNFSPAVFCFHLCPSRPVQPDDRPGGIYLYVTVHPICVAVLCYESCTTHSVQLSTSARGWP